MDLHKLPGLLAAEDWPGAERLLRRAVGRADAPAEVFYNLAKVLEAAGKYSQSGSWLRKATARRVDYGVAWYELGRWAIAQQDLPLAQRALGRALALMPRDRDTRVSAARVALRLGDWPTVSDALGGLDGAEIAVMRYRAQVEAGDDARSVLADLLDRPAIRPATVAAMTRMARGAIPRRLSQSGHPSRP